ncbi:prepilin-type N-terminal cleavage/methylation domain-containing protein [Candidatus Sumerlaeota bacterium]|nr:prepilin-type N-terminal cleavage/methylation domain-containing protein [Candidatus Sumerlaeota bacterium]
MRKRAYSLIELLMCVAIISILSSLSLVSYQGAVDMAALRNTIPVLQRSLYSYQRIAREENTIVRVEFIIGTNKIRVTKGTDADGGTTFEDDFNFENILKKKFKFTKYEWPDGSKTPATFTFFPDGKTQGGSIYFGSGFADGRLWIKNNAIVSNI